MRTVFTFFAAAIVTASVWAQSPQKMSYQAVIRNTSDELVTNQPIGLRVSIILGSVNGTVVYTETQTATSNAIGLVSVEIGVGPGFDEINWANGPYFIKTETDPVGGSNYTITNTVQLLSVPYALHAKTAENLSDGITETDPVFGTSPAKNISESDIDNWNNKQSKLKAGKNIIISGDSINASGMLPKGKAQGEMLYWNDTTWALVTPGTNGSTLSLCNNIPTWGGCVPVLTTASVSAITQTSAISGGNITSDRGFPVTVRGICWSTSPNPTVEGNHTISGNNAGTFVSNLTGLTPNTTYYARAYAVNSEGIAYGNEVSFTTTTSMQELCFSTPTGINSSNWSYKDFVIPDGYKIDSVYMGASRPGYPAGECDINFVYCPGTAVYDFSVALFPMEFYAISTSMYNIWLDVTTKSIKAPGMVRVKLPTGAGAIWNNLCFAISEINSSAWRCGSPFTINHTAGSVAPVSKTVTYGTVTNIPGEPSKCWITQNLGADHQATAVDDTTEASAGWYWQFNRKQGYKHDGKTRTPNTEWNFNENEESNWTSSKDPCFLELGNGWRIPTSDESTNIDAGGNWINWHNAYNSGLKLNAAGGLGNNGWLFNRGSFGHYWSSFQSKNNGGWGLFLSRYQSEAGYSYKGYAYTIRCIKDSHTQVSIPTVTTLPISDITTTSSSASGKVISDGGATVISRGFCWSTSRNPTINDSFKAQDGGLGIFTFKLDVLNPGTTYYAKAFATNSEGTGYGEEVTFTVALFEIGQIYQGGKIFYIDSTGKHGLIASSSEQFLAVEWGPDSTLIGGTKHEIGTGQANTLAIVNGCSQAGIAARLCYDLVLNGYDDWFLPSYDELFQMCDAQIFEIPFDYNNNWSSTEYSATQAIAFSCGYKDSDGFTKTLKFDVRPVRAF
jgi:hypothetical protein